MSWVGQLKNVALFQNISDTFLQIIAAASAEREYGRGDKVIAVDEDVPGVFILVEGNIAICMPDFEHPVAEQGPISTFGEMSLIDDTKKASADVVVSSDKARMMFCPSSKFEELINNNDDFAKGFYQSAAALVSQRLRQTNLKVVGEVQSALECIDKMFETSGLSKKILQTQGELDEAGGNIVSKLIQVMPLLDQVREVSPGSSDLLQELQAKLEDIFLVESQKFDRISQELNLLVQYFENLKRVASGGVPLEISGDEKLFAS